MTVSSTLTTCNVAGCNEPRYVSSTGERYAKCHDHQREYWARRKIPIPGLKPRGIAKGTKLPRKPKPDTPKPTPKPTPRLEVPDMPKSRGKQADPTLQIVVIGEDSYQVYAVAFCSEHKLDECRTPERVLDFYKKRKAIAVLQTGVLG